MSPGLRFVLASVLALGSAMLFYKLRERQFARRNSLGVGGGMEADNPCALSHVERSAASHRCRGVAAPRGGRAQAGLRASHPA